MIRPLSAAAVFIAGFVILAAAPQQGDKTPDKAAEAARLNNIGAAYMNQQLFEKALKAFQDAQAADPKLSLTRLNEGIALLNLGRVDPAKAILEEAVKRNPNDPNAWYNLGLLQKNSSSSEEAVKAFRRVTEIDPNDADSWYFLGTTYSQQKQYPQAIEAFQHAIKLNPLHASAEFGMSRAYQQSGDIEKAREHLKRFQYITQNKLGSPISLAYGEQGQYSRVEESKAEVQEAPPAIPVKFVDVTALARLESRASAASGDDKGIEPGSGACFIDYDNDGNVDIFLADNGPSGGMSLEHNLGNGKFEDVSRQAGIDSAVHAIGCTSGDYDNDGFADLAVTTANGILLLHNENHGTFKDVAGEAGTKSVSMAGLTFIDYDHDGDLDLYGSSGVVIEAGAGKLGTSAMWRNNGNGTFTNVTGEILVANTFPASNAIGSDLNNDRAVDLLVADASGGTIFQNPREGDFRALHPFTSSSQSVQHEEIPTVAIAVLDFDHDGWMDAALAREAGSPLTLWRNDHGKHFTEVPVPKPAWEHAYGVAAFDYDNDGWVDLVAVGETKGGKGEARLFRNLGPQGFKDVTTEAGLDKINLKSPRAVITGDYDNDGATDLLITQNHGPAVLLRNQGGNQNHWMRLALKGLNDNKSAIGTKVEVFAGGNRQKFEIAGSSGYLGQNSPYLTIGLGQAKEADVVRMLWPTGVLQDEIQVAADKQQSFLEIDRRGSSCPTLFVWDGHHYELVADVLGAGVVGHWVAPGERNIPRPAEYVKVDRSAIREKAGKLSFRLMEPMEEVVYLDRVKLLAVDHPEKFDVYPNEYFASNPPYPPFKVVTAGSPQPPASAWDEHGHDLLPDLLAHRYVGDFKLAPFEGFTEPHTLELDLGRKYDGGPLWLLMHGEIEYFTATGMYAASQAGIQATAPSVEALNPDGKWVKVVDDMGFPAGGPRTMTADLTGKLPRGTQRIRISTNLQIYWNSILISRTPQNQALRLTEVPLQTAGLAFHGYPKQIEAQPPGVVKYKYEDVSLTGPYARQSGTYTRYGDVLPLLAGFDDRLVVFGSGEGVELEFDPAKLPPLPKGWIRDYFFLANGYEKDMDFYAYSGNTVAPLPFRGMGSYPYPGKSFPLDDRHLDYLLNFNTRYVSGNEPRGYWYDYSRNSAPGAQAVP